MHLITKARDRDSMFMGKKTVFSRWQFSPNFIYRVDEISIRISINYLDVHKLILKFIWTSRGSRVNQHETKERELED